MPVWVEIHVDDEVLSREPARWPQARDLIAGVADLAAGRGARLCFRFREAFATAAIGSGLLPALEAAGHEIGVHAHGRRLAEATAAVRACGVRPLVAAPGLVQAGAAGREALLKQAVELGFALVTDHGPERAWAYEGLLPREEAGALVMAPTVRPFDWGLMGRDGTRRGLQPAHAERLRALERQAAAHGARWFGLALHEHDLCAPGTLAPRPEALAALAAYLDARVGGALAAAHAPRATGVAPFRARSDARVQAARAVRAAVGQVAAARRRLPPRPRLAPAGASRVPVAGRHVALSRSEPPNPRAICLLSAAGREGGRRLGLRPFGLPERDLLAAGWALWRFDRAGTGDSPPARGGAGRYAAHPLAPGNPAHLADWRAVLQVARTTGLPVVALSWSAGIVPVLQAAAAGDRPDALVDGEGPADRWSLVPPEGNELAELDPWDDAVWAGLEPARLIAELQAPYARLQAERDHRHDRLDEHARRMVAAATAAGLPTLPLRVLAGRIHAHERETLAALEWALEAAGG